MKNKLFKIMFMNSDKPLLSEIILRMIKHHPKTSDCVNDLTGVNVTRVAEILGIPQPSLKKILDGKTRSMRYETEELFKSFFNVSSSQLRGDEPIGWILKDSDKLIMSMLSTDSANTAQNDNLAELLAIMPTLNADGIKQLIEKAKDISKKED